MPIGWKNLDAQVQAAINGNYPDLGQIHYLVDSDFRTAAQGWTRSDKTGPLDLYTAKGTEAGGEYVFYTPGVGQANAAYGTDAAAVQAAIDACVDFRGDTVFLTPGAYSVATVLTLDSATTRFLGPPGGHPRSQRTSITGTIAAALTVSANDVELANLRLVPLTATEIISIANGANRGYVHNFHYDSRGVSANTGTEFVNAIDTTTGWLFERGFMIVDAQQGDMFTLAGAIEWELNDLTFYTKVAAYATAMTLGTNCEGIICRRLVISGDADGTMTNFITGETDSNNQIMFLETYISDVTISDVDVFETGFGTDTDICMGRSFQAQSNAAGGGLAIDLA